MYGQSHPLSQKTPSGKIMLGLTFPQLAVVLLGAKLSFSMANIIPAIPVKNFVFAHSHQMIPLYLSVFVVLAREKKTGLPVALYFYNWILFKLCRKKYVWRRD